MTTVAASGGDRVSSPAHQRTFSTSSEVAVFPSLQCVPKTRSAASIRTVEPDSLMRGLPKQKSATRLAGVHVELPDRSYIRPGIISSDRLKAVCRRSRGSFPPEGSEGAYQ